MMFAASLGIGAFVWLAASVLVPLAYADRPVEYVFLGASPWLFAASTAVAFALLAAVRRTVPCDSPDRDGFLAPLAWLGGALAGAIVLLPGAGTRLAPLAWVLIDLRPWWAALLVVLAIVRFDRARGAPWTRRVIAASQRLSRSSRLSVMDAAIFVLLAAWAVVSLPHLRFTPALHGDEPKYLRFCEAFYQGQGLDVGAIQTYSDLTLAYEPPVFRNIARLGSALRQDASHAAEDLRAFAERGLTFQYNRAEFIEGWFLRGRSGRVYQVHNPGLSAILFPAYFVDRHFVSSSGAYQDVFPSNLPATNLAVLIIWAIWGVVVFRMLHAALGRAGLAWMLAAAAMLTLPVAAFPFQIYPEALAGLIVSAAITWLLYRDPDRGPARAAMAAGAAAGFLPWLHVRFLPLSAVLAIWAMASLRRRRLPFAAAYVPFLGAMSLYAYHLTGSVRPDAMYGAAGSEAPWRLAMALQSAIAYPFDRIWGALPHAPVYLVALPGWLLLARAQPRAAALLALCIAALAIPSAGHNFTGFGATPLRHLAAVMPLAMVPAGAVLKAWGRSRFVRVAFAIALVVSLHASLSYNLHHTKDVGRLIDAATSGWALNLMFPWTHAEPWARWPGTFVLFLIWVAVAATLLVGPSFVSRASVGAPRPVELRHAVMGVAAFVAIASAATALGGEPVRADYFPPVASSRSSLIDAAMAMDRCGICYSSTRGEVGRTSAVADSNPVLTVRGVRDVKAGEPLLLELSAASADGKSTGTVAIDFGDGRLARAELNGSTTVAHAYSSPGMHRVDVHFMPHAGAPQRRTHTIAVRPDRLSRSDLQELPESMRSAPAGAAISRVWLGASGVSIERAAPPPPLRGFGGASFGENPRVYLFAWSGDRWTRAADTIPPGTWVAVLASAPDGTAPSEPVIVRWPDASLVAGAPVVLF